MQIRCCIFDFAGTLVDLRPAFIAATLAAVEQWAPGKVTQEELAALYSGPFADPFIEVADGRDALADEMRRVFMEHLETHGREKILPFPGVPEMLAALAEQGLTVVAIVGSARAKGSGDLAASGLAPYVSATVFQDDVVRPKPFADAALRALELSDTSAAEALLIGDSELDMQCGRLAGISTGAALWGALDKKALLAERPQFVFAHPDEVVKEVRPANP